MTFHFAHMAPPGATAHRTPAACWLRDARTGRLVQHWLHAHTARRIGYPPCRARGAGVGATII